MLEIGPRATQISELDRAPVFGKEEESSIQFAMSGTNVIEIEPFSVRFCRSS
jgi:hypothetical protein